MRYVNYITLHNMNYRISESVSSLANGRQKLRFAFLRKLDTVQVPPCSDRPPIFFNISLLFQNMFSSLSLTTYSFIRVFHILYEIFLIR